MNGFGINNMQDAMPAQKVSSSKKKTEKWQHGSVDGVIAKGNSHYGRSTRENKQRNYNAVNSIFEEDDYSHVLDPYGQGCDKIGNNPAKLRDINLIVSKVNFLKGEEMRNPFNHAVIAVNGEAVSAKEEQRKKMLSDVATGIIAKELGVSLEPEIDPETGEPIPVTFSQVEKYMRMSHIDVREKSGNHLLNYLTHQEHLKRKFNEGFEHAIVSAEEIYYIGVHANEPKLRVVNPLNCEFDRNPDNPLIEDGDWFRENRWMTAGQIIDEFGEYLTDAEIDRIEKDTFHNNTNTDNVIGFAYEPKDYEHQSQYDNYSVIHVVWTSFLRLGILTIPSPDDAEPEVVLVDDGYKLTQEQKAMGYELEWRWVKDIWHGTRIGQDIYVNIEPVPNQRRSMDNLSEAKLPYVGRVYNATNSIPTSFVDLIVPMQQTYNVVWYRLMDELAKAKGKKFVMDYSQIPKSEGIDVDRWMYMFDTMGIAMVNSFEEGREKFQGQTSNFNQYAAVDMTLSQSIGQYIGILSKIEQSIDRMAGISPQREGQTSQYETSTGVEQAISQSSIVTEPWFRLHDDVKTQVLTHLLEIAKLAYPKGKKIHYITGDLERVSMDLNMEKFSDSEYGVFVSDSAEERSNFAKLEALVQPAISSGLISYSDAISTFKTKSFAQLAHIIKESEMAKQERDSQAAQQEQVMQQERLAAEKLEKDTERAHESNENQLDRENAIRVAALKTTGFDTDTQDNDQLDVLKAAELQLKASDISAKMTTEQSKLLHSSGESELDRNLKKEEIASKERIEKLKAETALKNKVVGE